MGIIREALDEVKTLRGNELSYTGTKVFRKTVQGIGIIQAKVPLDTNEPTFHPKGKVLAGYWIQLKVAPKESILIHCDGSVP